jgi:hypothetical protein
MSAQFAKEAVSAAPETGEGSEMSSQFTEERRRSMLAREVRCLWAHRKGRKNGCVRHSWGVPKAEGTQKVMWSGGYLTPMMYHFTSPTPDGCRRV